VVADIGAGTGMLAELFLGAGHRVLAIEPNEEMLAACRKLAVRCPALDVVRGSAEATTLPDACIDLITVVGRCIGSIGRRRTGSLPASCARRDGC
jgi:precorrin-6B methylase 2